MEKLVKTKWLMVRIAPEEKVEFEKLAKDNGFDSLSSYVLWALRKQRAAYVPVKPA